MSLHPQGPSLIPAETERVARAAFPKGCLALHVADALGPLFQDQQFATLFPPRGQPAAAPARLALVTLLQFAEGLSDRQAAEAVRGRIDWKYALALELTHPGFDHTVLSEFRSRLVEGKAELLLLDTLLARCRELGLLKRRGSRAKIAAPAVSEPNVHEPKWSRGSSDSKSAHRTRRCRAHGNGRGRRSFDSSTQPGRESKAHTRKRSNAVACGSAVTWERRRCIYNMS